jgi:hypothetical protein
MATRKQDSNSDPIGDALEINALAVIGAFVRMNGFTENNTLLIERVGAKAANRLITEKIAEYQELVNAPAGNSTGALGENLA